MIFSGGPEPGFWLPEKILETTNGELRRQILGLVGVSWMSRKGGWVRGLAWLFGRKMALEIRCPSREYDLTNMRNALAAKMGPVHELEARNQPIDP